MPINNQPADSQLATVGQLIQHATHAVAFTGAGISTDSGIPDLAGIAAILNADKTFHGDVFHLLDPSFATRDPATFYRLYRQTFFHPDARPNAAHHFLAQLATTGHLAGVVTMNIDYLHQLAGSQNVAEYWGDLRQNHCIHCQQAYDWDTIAQQPIPHCHTCGQLVLPDFVQRNLATYPAAIQKGHQLLAQADLVLIIGTQRNVTSFPKNVPKIVVNSDQPRIGDKQTIYIQTKAASFFEKLALYL
ncbi:NAD-dependent deacetylase family protein [Agrilactobacillus composti DSM 18527 = JCM 14202]|uniref:protein acetyllysine N-acetyltransferase n=1 Tax=Agrilactobacillus composti DSM 18527 = JCM 14202 TaxID=1423734 RepID=X0PNV6_9LACO|nr:Sir2 family NAD-dependent protein deacetylase [Agrilactobacillus composti]KRM33038.1 NAD-dependent deacetylase family protein [Agrilactobacillus composti DSM 18527 = JCM 14202]GAF38616.1 NAD-dependent protein deacetylase of SIR2 family [Agrilactobacillus composti DSM 18527 = JCM 14202]